MISSQIIVDSLVKNNSERDSTSIERDLKHLGPEEIQLISKLS